MQVQKAQPAKSQKTVQHLKVLHGIKPKQTKNKQVPNLYRFALKLRAAGPRIMSETTSSDLNCWSLKPCVFM